ncbi:hypothetical protein Mal64_22690 [Pseudobythopirellula maris]|uniref:HEAT repeat protein n=1 Tax=Pseudobythopirellula maris TaxID=2527991 RepID=A0A5C5ZPQ3_9BACT|nr:hypothetical protein [Pseudobythopirellula maris]TWT88781.1 hypothetical protein Mal64_22690 [Pseudobythopirellula maris]
MSKTNHSALLLGATLLAALACVAIGPSTAAAQRWEEDEIDARLSNQGAKIKRHAKSGASDPEKDRALNEYFDNYFFPAMTRSTPDALEDVGDMRVDLFRSYIWPSRPQLQKALSDKAFAFAIKVVKSRKYHPSVTYNALLILGALDNRYAGSGSELPTPSANANKMLINLAVLAARNPKVPRYWLSGALIGLERHARFQANLPPASQQLTARALVAVLAAKSLSDDKGVDTWMRMRAAKALAQYHTPGPKDQYLKAISKQVADETMSLDARAEFASLWAELDLSAHADAQLGPTIDVALKLALDIAAKERASAERFESLQLGRRGPVAVTRDNDPRIRNTDNRSVSYERRGLVVILTDLKRGLEALKPTAGDRTEVLDDVIQAVSEALAESSKKSVIDLNVTEAVKQMANQVQSVAAPKEEATEEIPADVFGANL